MKKYFLFALPALVLFCTSCFALPTEEPVLPPPLLPPSEIAEYRTITAALGNVESTRDLSAYYVPSRVEDLSFTMNGEIIKDIYVSVGDAVTQGQVVAELESRLRFQQELDAEARNREWVELDLRQLEENHQLDLRQAEVTGEPLDDSGYRQQRAALENDLEMNRIQMEYLRFEEARRVLYAGMDGTVTSVMNFKPGDDSGADLRVVGVADQTQSIFAVRGMDTEYLEVGRQYPFTVEGQEYIAEVVPPEDLDVERANENEAYLTVVDGDAAVFNARSYGMLHVVLEEAEDVMYVPVSAVKQANGRFFVYVLEDGIRTIRDVEVGLRGNNNYEIKSGLTLEDLVIID